MTESTLLDTPALAVKAAPAELSRRALWLVLIAAFLGWMFDGLEMGIFPLVARPALRQLLHLTDPKTADAIVGPWMGWITALFLIGAAAGGFLFGWIGDRFGRVRAMALSVLAYSAFTGLCYFATAPWHLAALRFLSALGMGGEWSLGVALVMECWPEANRPVLAGAIGAASNVGFALIAVLGYLFKVTEHSWRWVMLAGAAPAVLTFLLRLFVPESHKWKASVRTGAPSPVREIFSPPLAGVTLLAIAFASIALIGTWASVQWIPLWVGKLTADPRAGSVSAFAAAVGAIFGCFIGAWLGGTAGRRITYFLLCLTSLAMCQLLYRQSSYGTLLVLTVFLVGATTASFYGWLPLYLPELFPTRVRATGQGVGFNSGRILAAIGALTTGQIVRYSGGSYAQAGRLITLVYLAGLLLIWLAPETKGKTLPD